MKTRKIYGRLLRWVYFTALNLLLFLHLDNNTVENAQLAGFLGPPCDEFRVS